MILDRIVAATEKRVKEAKAKLPLSKLQQQVERMPITKDFPFEQALQELDFNFICEVKKASPSKGVIAEDFPYLDIAKDYEMAGAAAISVLTEPDFFLGSPRYLQEIAATVHIPVLRKDFIIDEYQIYEAKLWGASAILLIAAILDDEAMARFHKLADSLGLSCLVEAHDETEVLRAAKMGARIIGVNNRNLKDFTVDVNNSIRLRNLVDDSVIFVSESGLDTVADIQHLQENKIHAALMGESFMRSTDKVAKLAELYGPIRPKCSIHTSTERDVLGTEEIFNLEAPSAQTVDEATQSSYEVKVKFCGISQEDTVPVLLDTQPDYVGFVFAPSKRQVTVDQAKILVEELHKQYAKTYGVVEAPMNAETAQDSKEFVQENPNFENIKTVGVFVNETVENLLKIAEEVKLDVIQLHGDEDESFIQTLKEQSNVEVWKAVQVRSAADAEKWIDSSADMLLFDAYHKDERGGTGEVFDWSSLDEFERPFMLAGGMDSTNVARAIRTVRPYGIDISSGIETEGVKDDEKIKAFTHIVRTIALS